MNEKNIKPIKPKPHFYSLIFQHLQQISKDLGYNLLLHCSMNRDIDLVAIPWIDEPKSHKELLDAFCDFLGTDSSLQGDNYFLSILPGGRHAYIINLNRGSKYDGYNDPEYYLDISITPLVPKY